MLLLHIFFQIENLHIGSSVYPEQYQFFAPSIISFPHNGHFPMAAFFTITCALFLNVSMFSCIPRRISFRNCSEDISPEFTFESFSSNSSVIFLDFKTVGTHESSSLPSSVEQYFFFPSSIINFLFSSVFTILAAVADVPILYLFISLTIFPGLYLEGGFVLSALH